MHIEGVSLARTFAAKPGYALDPKKELRASARPISQRQWGTAIRGGGLSQWRERIRMAREHRWRVFARSAALCCSS